MTPDLPMPAKRGAVPVLPVPATELHIFAKPDGAVQVQVQVRVESGTVWLTQKQMAAMYGVTVANISQHLKNIFTDGELLPDSVVKNYLITALAGTRSHKQAVNHARAQYDRSQSVTKASSGIPLITARNVKFGRLDFSVQEYVSTDSFYTWMKRVHMG